MEWGCECEGVRIDCHCTARLNPDDINGPALKKIKQEVTVSECVSSSRDHVGGQQGTPESSAPGFHHATDEDSLSGESLDGHTQGLGSRSSLSLSPCPPTDPTPTPTWSRHLMQQTLMDEGLRLARLVSHDRVEGSAMSLPRTLGELQLYRVLQRANLLAYYDTFIQQGGDDVQQLCEAGEEEFLEIMALVGMATKPLHVRRLQKALREWATNPSLFNQTLNNVPVNSIPLFKISDTTGGRKSLSNGHASNSPGEQERSGLTPQRSSSPKSPSSQTSELSRDKLQLSPFGRHTPEPDGNSQDEEQPSPPPTPPATSSPVPGGRLEPEAARAVTESVDRLMKTMPCAEPSEVKALLKLNKKLAKTVGHIFNMENSDPAKEEEIRKYSLIYGRFDSKRREGKQLSAHELTINEAAAQFCIRDNALLLRRVELFSLARQVARECAYTSTLRGSSLSGPRRCDDVLLLSREVKLAAVIPPVCASERPPASRAQKKATSLPDLSEVYFSDYR
ncbi:NGFI-A-binding protein 2 [Acipenser ruthenus]|uniref:NGFI-A-binding protein 2 n=1 Tax=Acipenser ruthenus TaxID=7906 RepID=A0A444UAX8_ACIRT|nr:NGFI-A-binding protein 2 [Acipenser ruthenus]